MNDDIAKEPERNNNNFLEALSPDERNELHALRKYKREAEQLLLFGVFEFDLYTKEGWWSDGLYALFGYSIEKPVVTLDFFIKHLDPAYKQEAYLMMEKALQGNDHYLTEYDIITKSGERKHIQVIGDKIFNTEGKPIKNKGIVRDITAKHEQKQHLSNAIAELERSNQELEEFAYVASHDLQEPLRKITTFTNMLSSKITEHFDDDARVFMKRIESSAESMRQLIDNLLEFSRISRNEQPFGVVNLNLVIKEVIADLDLKIADTHTEIVADILPSTQGVASLVKQLFNNLISNSIKFRKEGINPIIKITTQPLDKPTQIAVGLPADKAYFQIDVADNGIGFEQQYAERIFKIFQRLHGKGEYAGSGIGLAISKKIVEYHNGFLFANSKLDCGAKFTIYLPIAQ